MALTKLGVNGPYDEGYKAFTCGVKVGDCPYAIQSSDGCNWRDGWFDAANTADQGQDTSSHTT